MSRSALRATALRATALRATALRATALRATALRVTSSRLRAFLLPAALLLAAPPAHALDLAMSFSGPDGTGHERAGPGTTVQDLGSISRLVAVEDGVGDRWVIDLAVTAQDTSTATITGTARLMEVKDPSTFRHFQLTAPFGQPVSVSLADPSGALRHLVLVASAPAVTQEVVCEILPAPTVDDLASALQELVDDGRQPHTGVGRFTLNGEATDATWICGW